MVPLVSRVCRLSGSGGSGGSDDPLLPPCVIVVSGHRGRAFLDMLLQVFVGPFATLLSMVHVMPNVVSHTDLECVSRHVSAGTVVIVNQPPDGVVPVLLAGNNALRLHTAHVRDGNLPPAEWAYPWVQRRLWDACVEQGTGTGFWCSHELRPMPLARGCVEEDVALLSELLQANTATRTMPYVRVVSPCPPQSREGDILPVVADAYKVYRAQRGFYGPRASDRWCWSIVADAAALACGSSGAHAHDFVVVIAR